MRLLPNDDFMVLYKCVSSGKSYTFATKTSSTFEICTNNEVEQSMKLAMTTTKYIDNPNDKGEFGANENSLYDKFILNDANPNENDMINNVNKALNKRASDDNQGGVSIDNKSNKSQVNFPIDIDQDRNQGSIYTNIQLINRIK